MTRLSFYCIATLMLLAAATSCGQEFPLLYNSDVDQEAAPLPAEAAAARWQVPSGFRVDVFAREPEVQNPIAMAWDSRGRLWVAENYTYAERSQRFDLTLRDRVLIFEDKDADGVADRRVVFTDQVQMLTSLEVGHGGTWLMCPPQLLFIPDADRDDVPDGAAQVVLDGFDVARDNYHNFANGLKWGPDGWLYGRCGGSCPGRVGVPGTSDDRRVALVGGVWRFHPQTLHFEVLTHGTTNPWGHDWNEVGEGFFINTVNGHLWHLIPGAHLDRPFALDPNPYAYELIDMHADHWHFDTGTTWQDSRDGAANSYGGGHAHCGMMIYLGGNWPSEYRGRLLTWNIHGRRANQELLERSGSGYVARHGQDTFLSADPFFRGMDLSYGPDGAVYVIDWSDTGECHEHDGVHRTSGRIYRIAYDTSPGLSSKDGGAGGSVPQGDLHSLTDGQLVELMEHENEWFARAARLVLAERASSPVGDETPRFIRSLRRTVANSLDTGVAYRSLVTLHAIGAADRAYLRSLLSHRDEHLRAWAVRLLTDHWPIDGVLGPAIRSEEQAERIDAECMEVLDQFCDLAARDASGLVRLALASALQRLPVNRRARLAAPLIARQADSQDHNLPLLVWYGLIPVAEAAPMALAELAIQAQWPKTQRLMARRLAEGMDTHPQAVERVVSFAAETTNAAVRRNMLAGISDGLKGWAQAIPPKSWERVVSAVATDSDQTAAALVRELSVLFGDGRALAEVRQIVLDENTDVGIRRSALEVLVESGADGMQDVCLSLLGDRRLNLVAAKGVSRSNDPAVAAALIENYRRFRSPHRPQVIEILASRRAFAAELLDAIAAGRIPVRDLTAFDVRQIRSLDDVALQERVTRLWGNVRDSSQAKRERIASLKQYLLESVAKADPSRGRVLFNQSCAKCHKLFGEGEPIGPDLTGSNRNNVDYLLENIVDPSAVVSKDFRMTVVQMDDGRVWNGLVVRQTDKILALQTQTDMKTINRDSVDEIRRTQQSPMPDGLLDNLSVDQIRDLFAYLMHPTQVALAN